MTPKRFRKLSRTLARRQPDLTVLAENVHKSHNIAALLRTCDAVGVFEMHAVSPEGEFQRHHLVSGGSQKWVQTHLHGDIDTAIDELKSKNFQLLAAYISSHSIDYREIDYTQPTALIVGSELDGLPAAVAKRADQQIMVPMRGLVSSLNLSVATALILYEAARQRERAGLYEQCRLEPELFARTLFEWCYPEIACRCRVHGAPYPELDADGYIKEHPFADNGASIPGQGT